MLDDKFLDAICKSRVPSSSSIFLCLQLLSMKLMLFRCGWVKVNLLGFRLLFLTREKWDQINHAHAYCNPAKKPDILCK